jgi:phosphatidate cytidylyltransferase
MTTSVDSAPPAQNHGRAGRDVPLSIVTAVVLIAVIAASLLVVKSLFIVLVIAALSLGIWELRRGLLAMQVDLPLVPLVLGGSAMIASAYVWGANALVTATAMTALGTLLFLFRRGVEGYVRSATAAIFTVIYLPFLGSFVALMLAEGGHRWSTSPNLHDVGVRGVATFIALVVASDVGGFVAGVLLGRHPMAPIISPKKSWEGFAGSAITTFAAGIALVVGLFHGHWYVGALLGVIAVAMAVLGDLVESVIKRDLGVKDMSQIIPGHGGIMDRLDSLLATVAPVWLVLHYWVLRGH